MQVEILGTVGYHPTEQRHTTCIALPELGVVFDAGSAMFRLPERLQHDTLDIFLTHTHLDHVLGLTFFFSITLKHPLSSIAVHGDAQKLAAVKTHLFAPDIFPVMPPYVWSPFSKETGEITIREAKISWFPLEHPGGAWGYRVDYQGRSMALITDTTAKPHAAYLSAIQGVDLLLHECNFPDGQERMAAITGHSCLSPVAQIAAAAQVKRLVLIHFDPIQAITPEMLTNVSSIYAPIELSYDGMKLEF
jgi:ribonuclease BN (tRNA processing enzyme)